MMIDSRYNYSSLQVTPKLESLAVCIYISCNKYLFVEKKQGTHVCTLYTLKLKSQNICVCMYIYIYIYTYKYIPFGLGTAQP